MPVVIASLTPKEGMLQELVETYTRFLPAIHAEEGCEFFTLHTSKSELFIVESWASGEHLRAHTSTQTFKTNNELIAPLLAEPPKINIVRAVPGGDPDKGILRAVGT